MSALPSRHPRTSSPYCLFGPFTIPSPASHARRNLNPPTNAYSRGDERVEFSPLSPSLFPIRTSISNSMALFSPFPTALSTLSSKPYLSAKPHFTLPTRRNLSLFVTRSSPDKGEGMVGPAAVEEQVEEKKDSPPDLEEKKLEEGREEKSPRDSIVAAMKVEIPKFKDPRWVGGTWDLKQFEKVGKIDWAAVIDAEARRRKWLEDYPEASSNEESIIFDTSIIPWWAWIQRFHLPEAERLNGRAAMIGFFMAYLVDSLTGLGLVDQMGNFFCKTLLFIAVVWVLLIRENEDIEKLKKILDETTLYDKQWQATWQDDMSGDSKK